MVWNVQRSSGEPFLVALQEFWQIKNYWGSSSRQSRQQIERAQAYRLNPDLVRQELLEPFFGQAMFKETCFENPMICDFQKLKGRILSNGNALDPGDMNFAPMITALDRIFQDHKENGMVTIEHDTRLVYGQLEPE